MNQNNDQEVYSTLYSFRDMILRLEKESQAAAEFRGRIAGDLKAMRDDLDMLQRILIEGDSNLVSVIAKLDERVNSVAGKTTTHSASASAIAIENQAKITIAVITAVASILAIVLPLFVTSSQSSPGSSPKGLKQITPPSIE